MENENEDAPDLDPNLTIPHLPWQLTSDLGFSSPDESLTVEPPLRDQIRRMELRARRLELRAIRSRHGWRSGSRNVSTGLLFRTNHEATSRKSPSVDAGNLIARALSGEETKGEGSSHFDCNICLQVARDPILTSCGHLFCWPCLYRWIHDESDGSNGSCFVCKGEVDVTSLTPIYGRGISGGGDWDAKRSEEIDSTVPPRPRGCRIKSVRQEMLSRRSSGGSVFSRRIEELMRRIGTRADLVVQETGLPDRSSSSGRRRSNSGRVQRSDGIDSLDAEFGDMGVGESVDEAIRLIGGAGEPFLGPRDSVLRSSWDSVTPWTRRSGHIVGSDEALGTQVSVWSSRWARRSGDIGGLDGGFGEMPFQESGMNEEVVGIRDDVAEDHLYSLPLVSGRRSYSRRVRPQFRTLDAGELVWGESLGPGNARRGWGHGLVDNGDSVLNIVGGVVQSEREMLDSSTSVGSDSIGSSSPPFRSRRRRNESSSSSIVDGGVSRALRRRMLA